MACNSPISAYKSADPQDRRIKFKKSEGYVDKPIQVPCGKCLGCKKAKSLSWSLRCRHEAQMHTKNCVLTLTYDNENLPLNGSISKEEVSTFMKRLRKKIAPKTCRFFACGEYGDKNYRPHYHIIIFGYDFTDKKLFKIGQSGSRQFVSELLNTIWKKGFATIGEVTEASCHYVAGYLQKKLNKEELECGKKWIPLGYYVEPEFALMSRRPGIGAYWLDRYESDIKKDYIVVEGKRTGVPRYYRETLKERSPVIYEQNRLKRRCFSSGHEKTYEDMAREEKYNEKILKLREGELNA